MRIAPLGFPFVRVDGVWCVCGQLEEHSVQLAQKAWNRHEKPLTFIQPPIIHHGANIMTVPPDDGWQFVGKHAIRFEPPDIVFSRPDGDMSAAEMRQIMELVALLPEPEKGLFGIIDASKAGRSDPAAVKMPDVRALSRKHRAVIYINARFYQRTLVGIFQRANKLLKVAPDNGPIHFFDTEAEARAWIAEQREQG